MRIEFLAPLGRAVERMKTALFRPFDFGKWIVVGFSAWLAWLGQQGGGWSGGNWGNGGDLDDLRREARGADLLQRGEYLPMRERILAEDASLAGAGEVEG